MTRQRSTLAWALMVLAACGGPETTQEETPTPPPPTQETPPPTTPPPAEPTWVTVPASDAHVRYTGRVALSSGSALFSYPGVSITLHFQGDALELLLKDQGAGDETTTNYYQVTLDAQAPVKLAVHANQTVYELGKALPLTEHTVQLVKLTESEVGTSELQGFRVHGQPLDPPARSGLRLEFIGDSITCGYGDEVSILEADNPTTGFHSVNENITRAYGWLTARDLGAEVSTVCYSGRGLSRNNTGETTGTLPQIYDRTLPDQSTPRWDFTRDPPNIVVVNLGTNDFFPGTPDANTFKSTYTDFVTRLRGYYPQARIVLAVGPLLSDDYPYGEYQWTNIQSWVSAVVKNFNDKGDARVHSVAFTPQQEPYGEDWHPSAATHEAMATHLTEFLRALP